MRSSFSAIIMMSSNRAVLRITPLRVPQVPQPTPADLPLVVAVERIAFHVEVLQNGEVQIA